MEGIKPQGALDVLPSETKEGAKDFRGSDTKASSADCTLSGPDEPGLGRFDETRAAPAGLNWLFSSMPAITEAPRRIFAASAFVAL